MTKQEQFIDAIETNDIKTVKVLLMDKDVNPAADNNTPVNWAADYGFWDIFELLLTDKRVNPFDGKNSSLCIIASLGNLRLVKLLIEHPTYKIFENCWVLSNAAENGQFNVVEFLLKNKDFDPSHVGNGSIRHSSLNGHIDIVKLLIKDKRVDPSDLQNWAIEKSFKHNHIDVVEILFQDNRVKKLLKKYNLDLYNELIILFLKNNINEF